MRKIYIILCILGIALPYYNLINYLKINNWSMDGFFSLLYENYAVSMISMEVAMNATDFIFTGGAILTWWVIPMMLIAGFITPLPYNYWRLKALGKGCH